MSNYTAKTVHEGGMRCRNEFTQGGAVFTTDVAAALGGRGEQPSPAALLAARLRLKFCPNALQMEKSVV